MQVQTYEFSGPFSHCRGECGRAVIAAVNELCEFCQGLKAELSAKPAEQPEVAPAPAEAPAEPVPCESCGSTDRHMHMIESEPETQPAFR